MVLTLPYMNVVRKIYSPFYRMREAWRARVSPRPFDQFVYTRGEVLAMLHSSGFRVLECRRSHYMTVLLRIPGMRSLQRRLFAGPPPRTIAGITSGTGRNTPADSEVRPRQSGTKQAAKKIIDGVLNLLIPNRLTVIAEKLGE